MRISKKIAVTRDEQIQTAEPVLSFELSLLRDLVQDYRAKISA